MNGHRKQWEFLKKSAELGRLPHALLFYGQEGLGKKALAMEFSKFLIGKISPPDFILIEPPAHAKASAGKGIQIGQIRDLIHQLSFKPYLADFKIAVINKAHLMTQESQNCFLKFLEEPTDKTHLILITEYPAMLLPTILSRVQKIRFFPAKGWESEDDEDLISDLVKISESDLAFRFQYAKNVPTENLKETLDAWLKYFRKILISRLTQEKKVDTFSNYSINKLKNIIRQIQSTNYLISTTNTNPRLALEILLIEL